MLLGVSYLHILIAVIAGFCASTIDTIAGGGGMIIVPVLLYLGLSPATVLGTNRMAGFVSEITAICHFKGAKQLQFKQLWFGMLCAVVAAIIGSRLVQILHPAHMQKIMPILLALALIYFIFAKRFTQQHKHQARMNSWLFYSTVGLLIGFYNGFFGPGTGSLWIVGLMFFLALPMQSAVMHAKPLNASANILSFMVFALAGQVNYVLGIALAIGAIVGASVGAQLVLRKGAQVIRPIFIVVVAAMTIDLFIKYY